jgi:SAM-dependent methyltransferase
MNDKIQTIFNSEKNISSNAEDFYRNYWTESDVVRKETRLKNRAIIDRFFPQGLNGKTILEIGVGGEGGILLELMHNNDVHGMDVSDSAISNCLRFGINVTKANLDSDLVPFQADCFDVVFAFEVFEHFANPQHALEEIRRVLKPGGAFICSIPATFTYHWPRLFYAGLFEMENFGDFLMANEFRITCFNDWMMQNRYGRYKVPEHIRSWSWYWCAEKMELTDAQGYFELGRYFWEKRNESGLRTRPIEAIDLFRKSLNIAPDDKNSRLFIAHALLYRAINGDPEEFFKHIDEIIAHLMTQAGENKIEFLARLLLINVEANRLGLQLLNPDDYTKLKSQLGQADGTKAFIEEITREEEISRRLASC